MKTLKNLIKFNKGEKIKMEKILKEILQELKDMHSHLNDLDSLYKFVNRVEMKKESKEEDKK